jgi:2-hydroxychromene-2-carboxylate isomerase
MPSAPAIEFWFEFASTYSYPAAMRIEQLARDAGVMVAYRPFLLGPIFAAQGWNDSPFNIYEAKGRYMWRDLARICDALGLPLQRPSVFPRSGLHAARVALAGADEGWCPAFVRAVYSASFAEDGDISSREVIAAILAPLVSDPAAVLARADSAEVKAQLRAQTEAAQAHGIFGSPSFVVSGELFWGNDRLEQALAWARGSEPPSLLSSRAR